MNEHIIIWSALYLFIAFASMGFLSAKIKENDEVGVIIFMGFVWPLVIVFCIGYSLSGEE